MKKSVETRIMKNLAAGSGCLALLIALFFACVNLDDKNPIEYEPTVTAGENFTFSINMNIDAIQENTSALVVSFLVPKSWNARQHTTVTYTETFQEGVVKTMSIIPVETAPKSNQGMTWDEALKARYGVCTNVLDDMEWVTFQSDEVYAVKNGDKQTAKITIVTQAGPDNLRFKLGYFINTVDDWLSSDDRYYKQKETDCIEVIDGEGELIDFCELHFNTMLPTSATEDDILTIKFQGEIAENDLDGIDEIYLVSKAITYSGQEYAVTECSAKNRMINESGKTFSLTFWAAGYFGIPAGEDILRIEYYFTNADGSRSVMQTYDNGDPDTWFFKTLTCK
jgi:hypothetical protein